MSKLKQYKLILPQGYERQPLPYYREWLAALRSGEYKQTHSELCDCDLDNEGELSYCCLGVLSKIQGRLTEYNGEWWDGEIKTSNAVMSCLCVNNPLYEHLEGYGRFPGDIHIIVDRVDKQYSLAYANDSGLTFEQIADIIEKVWKEE